MLTLMQALRDGGFEDLECAKCDTDANVHSIMSQMTLRCCGSPKTGGLKICMAASMIKLDICRAQVFLLADRHSKPAKTAATAIMETEWYELRFKMDRGHDTLSRVMKQEQEGTLIVCRPGDLADGIVLRVQDGRAYVVYDAFSITMMYLDIVKDFL